MPYGGEVIETIPDSCPANHRWGRPVNGVTLVTVSWTPCRCASARARGWNGHRTFACQKPGCGLEVLRPACSGPTYTRAIHT